jgi:ABC-type dipeptide/oligopeptide/nickel transport system permease component/ABC-type transport system substrate-binding protein
LFTGNTFCLLDMPRRFLIHIWWLLAAVAGLAGMLWISAMLLRPDMSASPPAYTEKELEEADGLRDIALDPNHPIRIQVDVDYSEGDKAPWYPKGEAPILAELVKAGRLPPLQERLGEKTGEEWLCEPCVMQGVDGIGNYGGTWRRILSSAADMKWITYRGSYSGLVRFSPQGMPIVPHLAKSYTISPDNKEFTFYLRRGVKWSDGQPFTADDIMYWYKWECLDKDIMASPPKYMKVKGRYGKAIKVDDYCVKFVFPEPYGLFIQRMAQSSWEMTSSPEHYLSKYHPNHPSRDDDLINRRMQALKLPSRSATYKNVKDYLNPEHPRMWPWVYRTYKANPPWNVVRNPYYWVVDTQGNQLPYLDRILFEQKEGEMFKISLSKGEVSMQWQYNLYADYTLFMTQRKKYDYELYHWWSGESTYVIYPNLNMRVDAERPEEKAKAELINNKLFRRALSLAIDRQKIIDAVYNGLGRPFQNMPEPSSLFYDAGNFAKYTEYDPAAANRLLDELGLSKRDYEGYRTLPDGSRLTFFHNIGTGTNAGISQFVIDDWAAVGLRVLIRSQGAALFDTEFKALRHEIDWWSGNGSFPMLDPDPFVPTGRAQYAYGFGQWNFRGGLYGDPNVKRLPGAIEPPPDHPLRKAMEIYDRAVAESDPMRQKAVFSEAIAMSADNLWSMNIATAPPQLVVVKNGFRNVPRKAIETFHLQSPGNDGLETYFWDKALAVDSDAVRASIKESIMVPTLPEDFASTLSSATTTSGSRLIALVKYSLLAIFVIFVLLMAFKHPYVGQRLLIMIPTLIIISIITFTVIQLPPGDYVTTRIMELESVGDQAGKQEIEDLRTMFYLDESMTMRYMHWMGLKWFTTFESKDKGLLQGYLGRQMSTGKLVNDIVGDRILLTILISLGTMLFTWVTAIPIGIYSAVRQYSITDYIFTFLGFIGMCVPSFLLALILMVLTGVSGLFSPEFASEPGWSWPKVIDLLKHIWLPVVVLGVGGTAGMIRVMRANLLDELKKPYVTTARAKGVRPMKLLFKYPVRLALNPFISGIGGLFPALVSGGAIVAMVLSLPTVGPLMLESLLNEDMYLAGSMLMVLSILGVVGTLISDLLLLWVDPRIRFEGGSK